MPRYPRCQYGESDQAEPSCPKRVPRPTPAPAASPPTLRPEAPKRPRGEPRRSRSGSVGCDGVALRAWLPGFIFAHELHEFTRIIGGELRRHYIRADSWAKRLFVVSLSGQ